MNLFRLLPGYGAHVYDAGREPAFLLLVAFILTLAGHSVLYPNGANPRVGECDRR